MESCEGFRLITRSDFDGLVCATLLKHLGMVKEIMLVDHPSTMQQGKLEVTGKDIIANLPFIPGAHLAFDHHFSETIRNEKNARHIIDPDAPSAARVIYNYFGGEKRFGPFFNNLMNAVDKADSGNFTIEEILHPERWPLLNFLVDKRTGIEEWGRFAISEYQFKKMLIDWMEYMNIDEIIAQPDTKQRAQVYFEYEDKYKNQLQNAATIRSNIVILDLRKTGRLYPGNRFMIYALYPMCSASILIRTDEDNESNVTFSVGKSIINRTCKANIGELMLKYGGGGHRAAGACHVAAHEADMVLEDLISALLD